MNQENLDKVQFFFILNNVNSFSLDSSSYSETNATENAHDCPIFAVVVVSIQDDNIPENDEYVRIEIRNPTGGATVDESRNYVDIIIMANDFVAGEFSFAKSAYLVKEGMSLAHKCSQ